ncbi:MAG TPA: response regulator [Geopsychrobacteraceae bacterium]|nr:response regulator [Geopsychrobacteraceae bacterium]
MEMTLRTNVSANMDAEMGIMKRVDTMAIKPELFQKQSKKILLVDDVDLFIEIQRSTLERLEDVDILTAHNGVDALRLVESEHPDLVFLDFFMGDMNGDECCRIIKEKCNSLKIPVVMITTGGEEEDFQNCWEAGCDDIMLKPINPSLLVAMARKYLKIDTRSNQRFNVANLKIRYGTNMQVNLVDYCVNLSMGGLFLASANVLPVDTELAVEFILPNQATSVSCQAKVVWVNGPIEQVNQNLPTGMGLCFLDLTLDDLNSIREYLSVGRLIPVW